MVRRLGSAPSTSGWSMSTIFALFLLLSFIATINVFIVSFAWEKLAAMEADHYDTERSRSVQRLKTEASDAASSAHQLFQTRQVSAEDWSRQSLACRWDD